MLPVVGRLHKGLCDLYSGSPHVAAAATTVALAPVTSATAAEPVFGYQGNAFGSSVVVAGVVTSAPTAVVTYGCGTPAGFSRTQTTAGVNVPPSVLRTNTITVTGNTSASPTESKTTATAQNVNVLGGLVTANAVTAASTARNGAGGYSTSAAGTSLVGLKVSGLPILVSPAPNTRINLPGIGYVVLNEQTTRITPNSAGLRVSAIRAVVTQANLFGYDVGTTVIVAQAAAAVNAPTAGFLGGFAYGTAAQLGNVLSSSPSFRIDMPCAGTNGVVRERNGAGVDVPNLLDSGTIRNTVQGVANSTSARGQATSTVETVSLLNGVVEATGVRSVANASRSGGSTSLGSEGTTFASITVNGQPLVVADIEPNTQINLAGIGTLHLRRTFTTATSIEVRAIEIVVLQAGNPLGLPVGTTVQVAVAKAIAR